MENSESVLLPRRLTAENGAKSLLMGEFSETIIISRPRCLDMDENENCIFCDNSGEIENKVFIQWDTIKNIYKKIVENLTIKERG